MVTKDELDKLRLVYNNIPGAMVILTPDFEMVSVNGYLEHFSGLKPHELIGKKCYDVAGAGEICPGCPVERAIKTGTYQWNIKKEPSPSGSTQYILQRAVPVFKNGTLENILEVIVDRTEQEMLKDQLEKDFLDTIEILVNLIELHDGYTGGHSHAVKKISVHIAELMGLGEEQIKSVEIAAVLHDIGKIGIKDFILNKQGPLTDQEFDIIKSHPCEGENAIKYIKRFAEPRRIIRHHHERYDGKGYPDGLAGKDIPLGSRILAVADAFDAMISNRAYRQALSYSEAVNELEKNKATQFDPYVVDLFLKSTLCKGW